jgi:hypothetical protein
MYKKVLDMYKKTWRCLEKPRHTRKAEVKRLQGAAKALSPPAAILQHLSTVSTTMSRLVPFAEFF